jgi:transposase
MRYELTEYEWSTIRPILPNKARGVPRVDDRRVLNGHLLGAGIGTPWRDLPECYGPYTTCYNRFVRWRGVLAYGGRPFHQSGLLAPAGAGLSLNNEDAQAISS